MEDGQACNSNGNRPGEHDVVDTLFHFVFLVIAAMAARVHIKHPVRNILIAAFIASVGVDLDRFILADIAAFHNVFATILLPLIFVGYAFHMKKHYNTKGLSILLLLFLSSHLFLDIAFPPGNAIFWPLSDEYFLIDADVWIPLGSESAARGSVASSFAFAILIYIILVLLPCYFLDNIIITMERKHESFRRALRDLEKSWNWKEV